MNLTALADRVQALTSACREVDALIAVAVGFEGNAIGGGLVKSVADFPDQLSSVAHWHMVPRYTASLDAIRSLGGMVVFASDIGADGLAMVKIVVDTSTSPIVEYTGIASQLQHAWLAASLRARAALENSHG